jgi:hypothetical protein
VIRIDLAGQVVGPNRPVGQQRGRADEMIALRFDLVDDVLDLAGVDRAKRLDLGLEVETFCGYRPEPAGAST